MDPTHSCGQCDLRALSNVRIGPRAAELRRGTRDARPLKIPLGFEIGGDDVSRRPNDGSNTFVRSARSRNNVDRPNRPARDRVTSWEMIDARPLEVRWVFENGGDANEESPRWVHCTRADSAISEHGPKSISDHARQRWYPGLSLSPGTQRREVSLRFTLGLLEWMGLSSGSSRRVFENHEVLFH